MVYFMKKALTILLISMMAMTFTACGNSDSSDSDSSGGSSVSEETKPAEEIKADTVGTKLYVDFKGKAEADPAATAQSLADAVMANPMIQFMPMTMPVEQGLLSGFGNAEIKGFKEGVMFGPAIGSIPFIGYVFTLDEGTDTEAFMTTLKDNADLRWNICVEAEEMVCETVGDKVFFVMSPKSFEEAPQPEM
ncbi:MAG: hypothetical protein IJ010_05325 [Ruminococcus sp.]|nr:hypothetical protein [Ruminococcus sp.]